MNFREYVEAGWRICGIDRGRKLPSYDDWNIKPIPADAAEGLDGAGLLHALSGTCAIDVDNLELARPWLAERGIDIDELLTASDAVRIDSGRPNRAKLLYRLKRPLRTFRPKGSGLELRCATAEGKSVQDVLPPSIHPDTKKPYAWKYGDDLIGDWANPPMVPSRLAALWREMAALPVAAPLTGVPSGAVDLDALRRAALLHDPDAEYEEWIRVGMQLHEGTNGAQEGFDIWCEWSRGIKRKAYPGDDLLRTHWVSFQSSPGKVMARGASLVAELPADAEEFPIEPVTDEAPEDSTAAALENVAKETRKAALEKLEEQLVYVYQDERYFDCERHKLISSDNSLDHMFSYLMPRRNGQRSSPAKALKQSGTKRFVDARGFHPGAGVIYLDDSTSYANLYQNRLPEAIEPMQDELERINWLFDRIDDPLFKDWLLQFFAHVVQKPGVKIKAAPLIWSETQGNGKTTLLRMLPALLVGKHYSREVTCALLNSDFNDYLLNAWHVNLTEFRAGTRGERTAISEKLKPWITDDTISIHPKGSAAYDMPNHFFVTATSNKEDAASIDNDDRRWAVHEMHAAQFTADEQHWIYDEFLLRVRASAVLRHYFLNYPITTFSPSAKAPETAARLDMIESSVSTDLECATIAFEQRTAPFNRDVVLSSEVMEYIHKHSPARPSRKRVGHFLVKPPFNGTVAQFRCGEGVYRAVILRNKPRWIGAPGRDLMAHIQGDDLELDILA